MAISIRLSISLLLLLSSTAAANEAKPALEPAFPNLIGAESGREYVHIVSESIMDGFGTQTAEEFVDLRLLKNAFITSDRRGRLVTYIEAERNIMYHYGDYFCEPLKLSELNPYDSGLWLAELDYSSDGGETKKASIHGVAAIWINAANRPKVYQKISRTSNSSELFREAHKWTVEDEASNTRAHFYFVDTEPGSGQLFLESIQIESTLRDKILRRIRIIEVDSVVSEEVRAEVLQVPVGYGCHGAHDSSKFAFQTMDAMFFGGLLHESFRLQLEATVTKYESVKDPATLESSVTKSQSDTIAVELVKTNQIGRDELQMIRTRDAERDTKLVYDRFFDILYEIDLKRGSCRMSNTGEQEETIALKFEATKSELKMDVKMLELLFVDSQDFFFIKKLDSSPSASLLYFERSVEGVFPGRIARVIRVYSASYANGELASSRLETVMIKVFNEEMQTIELAFHINVVEALEISAEAELARLFDVSEECYVNNERMRAGRDFAWLQVSYSIPSKLLSSLEDNLDRVRELVYSLLHMRDISILNAPRIELTLDGSRQDDSVLMRILLLDLPPLPVLYKLEPVSSFEVDKSLGDLEDLAQDLAHCADLCRLNSCQMFSFNENTFVCLVGVLGCDKVEGMPTRRLIKNSQFQTYVKPEKEGRLEENLFRLSLHRMLADLQHRNYDALLIPQMPEEMSLPASETGVTHADRFRISQDYFNKLARLAKEEGESLPLLTFVITFEETSMAFVANRIEVELDPLKEFSLLNKRISLTGSQLDEDEEELELGNFKQGLSLHRYKLQSLLDFKLPEIEKRAKQLNGFTYEQCAAACLDRKCSSFSYCSNRRECVLTDIWDIGAKMSTDAIERDSDCFIAQRDFIGKFNKFSGVPSPAVYKKSAKALNPSECAHACVVETDFNCLAFDFCPTNSLTPGAIVDDQTGSCFYRAERFLSTGSGNVSAVADQLKPSRSSSAPDKACDHYSRSYLADFTRIEYRKFDDDAILRLKTETLEGLSVDQCADRCANQFSECTAFQFCLNSLAIRTPGAVIRSCTVIDSKPEGVAAGDARVVVNGSSTELVEAGKLLAPDEHCHVFSLRPDSSEARMRDPVLEVVSVGGELNKKPTGSSEVSFVTLLLLFLSLTLLFGTLAATLLVARDKSDFVRTYSNRIHTVLRGNK